MSDPKDEISHITGSIYISSYIGAKHFWGTTLNVHHDCTLTRDIQIPLLAQKPNSAEDRTGAKVNLRNLELLIGIIEDFDNRKEPLLVHCKGGIERSPLTVAMWYSSIPGQSLDKAYELIKARRPIVEDRRYWLPEI